MIVRYQLGLDGLRREAWFSDCERYRYWLSIDLCGVGGRCVFVMLNPSTASHLKNDPTVAKCCRFAARWGYGSVGVLNIFAWRATDPEDLPEVDDPVGPENDSVIMRQTAEADIVVCAWSAHGDLRGRSSFVRGMLHDRPLHYLKLTKTEPHHPLYLKEMLRPTRWLP
jgi:hypothetical protein